MGGNESADGMIKLLVFFVILLIFFWCINIYKHIKSGWSKTQKIFDIIGAVSLLAMLAAAVFPLIKN